MSTVCGLSFKSPSYKEANVHALLHYQGTVFCMFVLQVNDTITMYLSFVKDQLNKFLLNVIRLDLKDVLHNYLSECGI